MTIPSNNIHTKKVLFKGYSFIEFNFETDYSRKFSLTYKGYLHH